MVSNALASPLTVLECVRRGYNPGGDISDLPTLCPIECAMDQLHEQVARARRRWCWSSSWPMPCGASLPRFVVATVAIAVPRLIAIHSLPSRWDSICLASALGCGLTAAIVWTYLRSRSHSTPRSKLTAASIFANASPVACRCLLKTKPPTSAARSMNDAVRAVSRIDVDDKFRIRLSRRAWLPIVPAVIAFLLVIFVDTREAVSNLDPNSAANTQEQIKNANRSRSARSSKSNASSPTSRVSKKPATCSSRSSKARKS